MDLNGVKWKVGLPKILQDICQRIKDPLKKNIIYYPVIDGGWNIANIPPRLVVRGCSYITPFYLGPSKTPILPPSLPLSSLAYPRTSRHDNIIYQWANEILMIVSLASHIPTCT